MIFHLLFIVGYCNMSNHCLHFKRPIVHYTEYHWAYHCHSAFSLPLGSMAYCCLLLPYLRFSCYITTVVFCVKITASYTIALTVNAYKYFFMLHLSQLNTNLLIVQSQVIQLNKPQLVGINSNISLGLGSPLPSSSGKKIWKDRAYAKLLFCTAKHETL